MARYLDKTTEMLQADVAAAVAMAVRVGVPAPAYVPPADLEALLTDQISQTVVEMQEYMAAPRPERCAYLAQVNAYRDLIYQRTLENQAIVRRNAEKETAAIAASNATYAAALEAASVSAEYVLPVVRDIRNELLYETDWTQLVDAPLTEEQKAAWTAYRQALRDFPGVVDPTNVVFPTPPVE